jgi:hypothetical protein
MLNIQLNLTRFQAIFNEKIVKKCQNTEGVFNQPSQILAMLRAIHVEHSAKFDEVTGDIQRKKQLKRQKY